jgi:hypothetical protein
MRKYLIACWLGLMQLVAAAPALAQGHDAHLISAAMKQQFDRPEAPLTVAPIVVEGDYAVAGWLQGGRGGRAFLQKDKDHWSIALCGGTGLTQADVLQSTGMTAAAASKLATAVRAAESSLGANQRRLFDSFEGMLKIDAAQPHGQHGQHSQHGAPEARAMSPSK